MLLDSNIVIYANSSEGIELREWAAKRERHLSDITRLEVLGFHRFELDQLELLTRYVRNCTIRPVNSRVIEEAIRLRQQRWMDIGDAIIAATALVHDETLATANTADFQWIPGLSLMNPLDIFKKS